jgi:hypothetical protein
MAKTRIAREVDEILASKPRHDSTARGEEAFRNIQSEARAAEGDARMADNTQAVAAQKSARSAHALVQQSEMFADHAAGYLKFAEAWVREARGTPQLAAVERVLASMRSTVSRAKAHVTSTKKAFEKHFGKYDPRGVRDHATMKSARGDEVFRNIQSEARSAESEARSADNVQAVAAQQSPRSAHALVGQSEMHAERAARYVEIARGWVREARGTPQLASVERVLASVRNSASRAKANVASTKKAFEKRFGKYDPRGVRDHATMKSKGRTWRKGEPALFWAGVAGWMPVKVHSVTAAGNPQIVHPVTGKRMAVLAKASLEKATSARRAL